VLGLLEGCILRLITSNGTARIASIYFHDVNTLLESFDVIQNDTSICASPMLSLDVVVVAYLHHSWRNLHT
jgi:hypothetical protein